MTTPQPTEALTLTLTTCDFRIRAANLDAATEALRVAAKQRHEWAADHNAKLAARGRAELPLPDTRVESVEAVFRDLGFTTGHDRAGGLRLKGFTGDLDSLGPATDALRAVEGLAESRSSLTWDTSDGAAWEYWFFRKRMQVRDLRGPLDMG